MQAEHENVTKRARRRDILQSGAEIALSIGWVIAFFLVFLGLLSVTFPKGTSLRRLASDRRVSAHVSERMTIDLQSDDADHELVAMLAYKRHKVKHKPADYLAWADSRTGMPLHNRHSVQTLNQSAATIAFDNTEMTLGENSLVVVKSFERDRTANVNRASLVVLDGELRGSVPGGDDSLVVEVIAGNDSRVRPTSKAGERSTFAVNVSEDGTSTVAVYEGSAEVTGSDGVVLVGANESVQVESSGRVSGAVERIPDVPVLSPDFASTHFQYRDLPPRVRLRWLAVEGADGYDVAIATDEAMSDVVFQTRTTEATVGAREPPGGNVLLARAIYPGIRAKRRQRRRRRHRVAGYGRAGADRDVSAGRGEGVEGDDPGDGRSRNDAPRGR